MMTTRVKKKAPAKKVHKPVKYARISIVRGLTGLPAIYINERRIVGEKPWGGGTNETSWTIPKEDLIQLLSSALKASQ
jgi:hypothetical protein